MSVLIPGCRVRICGLAARPELNGRLAEALQYVSSRARWEVKMDGEAEGTTPLGLRGKNLEPIWDYNGDHCAICLLPLGSRGEKLPCLHSFHKECIDEMRNCGGVVVCACCRRKDADSRTVQWLVDEAVTLIIQARHHPSNSNRKVAGAYTLELLKEARYAKPIDVTAHCNLGTVLELTGSVDAAIAVYRRAAEEHPNDADIWISLGAALGQNEDISGAIDAYRAATIANPNDANSHCSLGSMLAHKGDTVAAIEALRAACAVDPTDVNAYGSLGILLGGSGDFESAAAVFQKALEVDPRDAEMHRRLADCRSELGDIEGAIAAFQASVEIDPSDRNAQLSLRSLNQKRREGKSSANDTGELEKTVTDSSNDNPQQKEIPVTAVAEDRRREIERRRSELNAAAASRSQSLV